jgi:hypothetical protein
MTFSLALLCSFRYTPKDRAGRQDVTGSGLNRENGPRATRD